MTSTLLNLFERAANYLSRAPPEVSARLGTAEQLQLYALYKQATQGPCTSPKPSFYEFRAVAKWDAWHKLGDSVSREEAMRRYIDAVDQFIGTAWRDQLPPAEKEETEGDANLSKESQEKDGEEDVFMTDQEYAAVVAAREKQPKQEGTGFGGALSRLEQSPEKGSEVDREAEEEHVVFRWCRQGNIAKLKEYIAEHFEQVARLRDAEQGATLLHWAVDGGHLDLAETLLSNPSMHVNEQDIEGQSPLHYACICERKPFVELLLKHGADPNLLDKEGQTPQDLAPSLFQA